MDQPRALAAWEELARAEAEKLEVFKRRAPVGELSHPVGFEGPGPRHQGSADSGKGASSEGNSKPRGGTGGSSPRKSRGPLPTSDAARAAWEALNAEEKSRIGIFRERTSIIQPPNATPPPEKPL